MSNVQLHHFVENDPFVIYRVGVIMWMGFDNVLHNNVPENQKTLVLILIIMRKHSSFKENWIYNSSFAASSG